jgi:hypothetical protein
MGVFFSGQLLQKQAAADAPQLKLEFLCFKRGNNFRWIACQDSIPHLTRGDHPVPTRAFTSVCHVV